jgi:hypothetical protein
VQKLRNACSSRYWTQLYRTISVQVAWFKVKKIGLCSSTPFLQDETVTMPKYALVTAHLPSIAAFNPRPSASLSPSFSKSTKHVQFALRDGWTIQPTLHDQGANLLLDRAWVPSKA